MKIEIKEEIQKIYDEDKLTATEVVNTAKDENNPLHSCFEWDDTVAGEKYREQQARQLINQFTVIIEEVEVPKFESVRVNVYDNPQEYERKYKSVEDIQRNEFFRKQMIETAIRELITWKKKYNLYAGEFQSVFEIIEELNQELNTQI